MGGIVERVAVVVLDCCVIRVVIVIVWSGCDYFQCDREIRFMCDGGKGGAKVDGGRWMYVGSRVYCILVFRICVYECVYDVVCLYIGVLMCMHMSAYVCGVSICVCLYVCGGADVAWMMGLESWWCRAAGRT